MHRFLHLLMAIALLSSSQLLTAQEEKKKKEKLEIAPTIEGYYLVGGLISSENFVFKSGLGFQLIAQVKENKSFHYGLGVGYDWLGDDQLIPVFLDAKAFVKKNKPSLYFSGQVGYSLMFSDAYTDFNSYSTTGGIMFSPGIGYRIELKNKGKLLINASYRQQFGRLEYDYAGENYTDRLSMNMLAFKLGYIF